MGWIYWISVVIGLWLIASPFALGYTGIVQATVNDISLGVVIAATSLWMALKVNTPAWLGWALMLFGVWVIVAPFALAYSATTSATMNDAVTGVIVLAVAITREVFAGRRRRPLQA